MREHSARPPRRPWSLPLAGLRKPAYSACMNVPASKMPLAAYLALDEGADLKHEYVGGAAQAMAGGSIVDEIYLKVTIGAP
jgi:hypothetical protein